MHLYALCIMRYARYCDPTLRFHSKLFGVRITLKVLESTDLKIILLDHQNNSVENSSMMTNVKSFDILITKN